MEVSKLYPQYYITKERRQQNASSPVKYERRSGMDRRVDDRIKLDTTLTKDIFEIKSKVAHIQKTLPKNIEKITFKQNIAKAFQNSIKTDQFIKSTKPNLKESPKELNKAKSDIGARAGLLGVMLAGTFSAAVMGVAGAVVAVGLGVYVGGRVLAKAIASHLKNK